MPTEIDIAPSPAFAELKRMRSTLTMIAADMASDAKGFDGQPFNGKTVAEYFGNQGAAIAALANIVGQMIDEGRIK